MKEILPGVFHWTAYHERIRQPVSSYSVTHAGGAATLIDPMLPEGGLESLRGPGVPERIVLTNRHHLRHGERIVQEFGCPVLCQRFGLHEFEEGPSVEPFDFGDELAPGITALEVGAICDEETALHLQAGDGALAFADGLVHYRARAPGFVPDPLLGDDPEAVKRGLRQSFAGLLDLEFDHLLFAHGPPLIGDGKAALRHVVEQRQ
jgi:hypothetical protein